MPELKLRELLTGCATAAMINLSAPIDVQAADSVASTESGDIVVAANKRTENLAKVGLTSGPLRETPAERKVISVDEVAATGPGLAYSPSTTNTPIFTLRGVGSNEGSLGIHPVVSVYIDQAALPFPVLASHTAFDLERVKVLKGPQGTLFEQNSTGAASIPSPTVNSVKRPCAATSSGPMTSRSRSRPHTTTTSNGKARMATEVRWSPSICRRTTVTSILQTGTASGELLRIRVQMDRARVDAVVLDFSIRQNRREQSWFKNAGFDPAPKEVPSIADMCSPMKD